MSPGEVTGKRLGRDDRVMSVGRANVLEVSVGYEAAEERYDRMVYRFCGRSGLALPTLSLGLWHNFGDPMSDDLENCSGPS